MSEPGVPDVLLEGDLTLIGQITTASNATLVCESTLGGEVHPRGLQAGPG